MSVITFAVSHSPFDMTSLDASLNEINEQCTYPFDYYAKRVGNKVSSRILHYEAPYEKHTYDSDGDVCMPQAPKSVVIPLYDEDDEPLFDVTKPPAGNPVDPYANHMPSKYHTTTYPMPLPDIDRSVPIPIVSTYDPIHSDLPLDVFMGTVYDLLDMFCMTHGIEITEDGIEYHYMKIKVSFKTEFEFVRSKHCVGNAKNVLNFVCSYDASNMYHTAVDVLVLEEVAGLYEMILTAMTFDP